MNIVYTFVILTVFTLIVFVANWLFSSLPSPATLTRISYGSLSYPVRAADRESTAMHDLAKSLQPTPGDWTDSASHCKWTGVSCNAMGQVTGIVLTFKSLSGEIPVILNQLVKLETLDFQGNHISGIIPDIFESLPSLKVIRLSYNNLTGLVPHSLTVLPNLGILSLENNFLQGPIPVLAERVELSLENNRFCQSRPGPCDDRVMVLLNISSALGYPLTLAEGWKGNNPCRGWTYISCDSKGNINGINFGMQNFTGTISPALSNLSDIETVFMNDNRLSGTIPSSLTSLTHLLMFDVSNNNLSGKVPPFSSDVAVITVGNPFLDLSPPSSPSGGNGGGNSSDGGSGNKSSNGGKLSTATVAGIIIGSIVVVMIIAVLLIFFFRFESKDGIPYVRLTRLRAEEDSLAAQSDAHGTTISASGSMSSSFQLVDLNDQVNFNIPYEVLSTVTNGFSEDNLLGTGGFGAVYRGTLPPNGTEVAIKRMNQTAKKSEGLRELKAEIKVLAHVSHKNLVGLHGLCVNGDEKLLVLEYMPKGTLEQHLFEWKEKEEFSAPFTWKQRLNIALDVARGVEYLHDLANDNFIHRDLKPCNILLGKDMNAKVADFGLVRHVPKGGDGSMETDPAGTFGYLDPHCLVSGTVDTASDVYSFGVILMVLITGRQATDQSFPGKSGIVWWFGNEVNTKKPKDYADPRLGNIDDESEMAKSIIRVAKLARHCTHFDREKRPAMAHPVSILYDLVDPSTRYNIGNDVDFGWGIRKSLRLIVGEQYSFGSMTTSSRGQQYSYGGSVATSSGGQHSYGGSVATSSGGQHSYGGSTATSSGGQHSYGESTATSSGGQHSHGKSLASVDEEFHDASSGSSSPNNSFS